MKTVNEEMRILADEITERISRFLPEAEGYRATIEDAMTYSVLNGGKRVRPILLLLTYRALGGPAAEETTLVDPFMAALEMIHSYSLVHDDLPAMDNDRFRRGKLTTHAKFGHAMGILAGDGLLNRAFETAVSATESEETKGRILPALRVLAERSGVDGMVGGQAVDVEKTGVAMTAEELDFVYRLKTGALLQAAMQVGAILAGASAETVETMGEIALRVGLAFQIQDDILDVASTTETLGKPVGSDEKNNKTTYVTLYGMRASKEAVENLSAEALDMLAQFPGGQRGEPLAELIASLVGRIV
ncbi:MAG: polyprenyl synthetase family protein [Lachnospiraceae bacterium]|nr:polyprenyl synthetase family protein [Lachnospiraceae bacterium]